MTKVNIGDRKVFIVYKTSFLPTGQYYYGKHQTTDPCDAYLGSSIWIKRAVKKYGSANFQKDVLCLFQAESDAISKEMELIQASKADPLWRQQTNDTVHPARGNLGECF
jgi:hypothetical protein